MAFLLPVAAAAATASTATAATAATAGAATAGATAAAAATVPAWLTYSSLALTAIGGITSAVGVVGAANAQSNAAKFNAEVAKQNADQALRNKDIAAQAGAARTQEQELKTRAAVGQTKANQAGAGIDVLKGSPLDVRVSEAEIGAMDALNVRSNATKEAYGYEVQSANDVSQAQLDRQEAKADIQAGQYQAAGTLIGTAGSAGSNYASYKKQGAIG